MCVRAFVRLYMLDRMFRVLEILRGSGSGNNLLQTEVTHKFLYAAVNETMRGTITTMLAFRRASMLRQVKAFLSGVATQSLCSLTS